MPETLYPPHTLAPDPHQLALPLRPPDRRGTPPAIRASPAFTGCCPNCAGVHMARGEYLACVANREATR